MQSDAIAVMVTAMVLVAKTELDVAAVKIFVAVRQVNVSLNS